MSEKNQISDTGSIMQFLIVPIQPTGSWNKFLNKHSLNTLCVHQTLIFRSMIVGEQTKSISLISGACSSKNEIAFMHNPAKKQFIGLCWISVDILMVVEGGKCLYDIKNIIEIKTQ